MKIFAALRTVRDFERARLPFFGSIIDFDIVIDVGYAQETEKPLTLKQLLLIIPSSRTTVRRRLASLIAQGIVIARRNANDQRSTLLTISPSSVKLLGRYAGAITSAFTFPPD